MFDGMLNEFSLEQAFFIIIVKLGEKDVKIFQIHSEKKKEKRNLCRFAYNETNLFGRDEVYLYLFLA